MTSSVQKKPEPREGMVMVYDWNGNYLGCMGIERWLRLLREDAAEYNLDERPDGADLVREARQQRIDQILGDD